MNEKNRPTFFCPCYDLTVIFEKRWNVQLLFLPSLIINDSLLIILHVDSLLTLLLPFIHVTVGETSHNHTFDMILIEILSPLLHWNARRWILLTITNNAYLFVSDDDEWQFQRGANTRIVENKSNGVRTTDAFSSVLFLVIVLLLVFELH